jgi:hypothetical protein
MVARTKISIILIAVMILVVKEACDEQRVDVSIIMTA